ncbi:MAG: dihydrofolate reductase [Chitinophagales bacterium]|nr:MAG: dihydrofolate reductase [Chitinophagales bacterium]
MIALILAVSENQVIGKDNKLPWHLPADMKHFVQLTKGHVVIMGRKTFESLQKPLPDRINLVVTRQHDFHAPGTIICHSLEEALQKAAHYESKDIFIIGGSEIYRQSLPLADRIYLTRIHHQFEGDTFFPDPDPQQWQIVSRAFHLPDEKNPYPYTFITYAKIK